MHTLPILQPSVLSKLLQHTEIRISIGTATMCVQPSHQIPSDGQIVSPVFTRGHVEFDLGLATRGSNVEEVDKTLA